MMKKYLKKGLAGLLTLAMALSALTCLAMADDEENDVPQITLYATCGQTEIRPGHDTQIDIDFTMGPVTDLMRIRCVALDEMDGLVFGGYRDYSNSSAEAMFGGEGEQAVSSGSHIFQTYAYYRENAFSCSENYHIFSIRYYIPEDLEEGEVTFRLESASFSTLNGTAAVNLVTEPIKIVVVDTSALERRLISAENYLSDADRYSDHSVQTLQEAVDRANEILENIGNKYQADVDEALDVLNAAVDGLKTPAEEVDAAIDAAEKLRESDYTEESWGNMTDALEAAKEIRDKEDVTDEELNGAADALYAAIDALEVLSEKDALAASREALEQAVETVKSLNQDDYSESSWAALQAALENAEQVLSNENATKEELDEAYDALALALARANLEKDVEYAKQLSDSGYTADSWEALQTAIAKAEEVLDNADATQAELEDADDALIAALNGLVPDGSGGTTTTYPGGTSSGGTTTTSGVLSPQTGDSSILLMCMIVLAVGMGTCGAVCFSKVRGRKE